MGIQEESYVMHESHDVIFCFNLSFNDVMVVDHLAVLYTAILLFNKLYFDSYKRSKTRLLHTLY